MGVVTQLSMSTDDIGNVSFQDILNNFFSGSTRNQRNSVEQVINPENNAEINGILNRLNHTQKLYKTIKRNLNNNSLVNHEHRIVNKK